MSDKGITQDELEASLTTDREKEIYAIFQSQMVGALATNRNKRDCIKAIADYIAEEIKYAEMSGMFDDEDDDG